LEGSFFAGFSALVHGLFQKAVPRVGYHHLCGDTSDSFHVLIKASRAMASIPKMKDLAVYLVNMLVETFGAGGGFFVFKGG